MEINVYEYISLSWIVLWNNIKFNGRVWILRYNFMDSAKDNRNV
jgi:hypothetical protein